MSTPVGPYTPVVRTGDLLYTSGQIGIRDGAIVDGGLEPELRQVFVNLRAVLDSVGGSLDRVVKTTVFLSDMNDFAAMNEVYARHFGHHRPARAAVQAAALPKGVDVEIECVARVAG